MVHIIGTLSGYIEWYKKQYIHAYMWLSNTSTCIDLYVLINIVVRLCDTFNFCFRLKKLLRNGKERDKRIKMHINNIKKFMIVYIDIFQDMILIVCDISSIGFWSILKKLQDRILIRIMLLKCISQKHLKAICN